MKYDNNTKYVIGAVAIAAALVAGAFFYLNAVPSIAYTNAEYGISFSYPESYQLH